MSNLEFARVAISLHTLTVTMLLDAVDCADTSAKRVECLALVRDAVLEFELTMLPLLKEQA